MKSPNQTQTSIPSSLTQSVTSSTMHSLSSIRQKLPLTPTLGKTSLDYSKSYLYDDQRAKKEDFVLRRSINHDEPLTPTPNRTRLESFLNNNSYFSIQQEKSARYSRRLDKSQYLQTKLENEKIDNRDISFMDNKSRNVEKILSKIQMKQKLISQLKELSKFDYAQTNKTESNQEINPKSNQKKLKQINELRQPGSTKNEAFIKNKNPQQSFGKDNDFKRAKNGYFTPKQMKSSEIVEDRLSSKLLLSKISPQNDKQKKGEHLYNSCRFNQSINEPKISTQKQLGKSIMDIRQISEFNIIKAKTSILLNKKISVSDFILLKSLGEGKFGSVFQAFHKETNSIYAIKKIPKDIIKKNNMIEQFIKEIKIQSYCHHENILQLFGFFDDNQYVYLILEYMQDGTLFAELKKRKTLSQEEAGTKLKQVAKAILYLHDYGIAHRDIKPENIVISNGIGKLCDFGWATYCGNDRRKTYCGTFDYAAPEILEGSEYDLTVDLWCLGVLAYELLVGKAPFYHYSRKETLKRILNVQNESITYPSHLSKDAISFIDSLIRKNPEQRMQGTKILNHPFILLAEQQEQLMNK